jgi:hypothetical protein
VEGLVEVVLREETEGLETLHPQAHHKETTVVMVAPHRVITGVAVAVAQEAQEAMEHLLLAVTVVLELLTQLLVHP